jgi:hypothetical protein
MSLLFAEGFETVADTPDMYARGLIQNVTTNIGGANGLPSPSRTGYPGKGWFLRSGPAGYSISGVAPLGGAGYTDYGMIPMGQSIYSLWQAGGFCVGFSASFNSSCYLQPAAGESQQLVYDGAQYYWSICYYYNGSTWIWGVAYSTDLKNWNLPITQPSVNQNSTITVSGSGPTAIIIVGSSSNFSAPASQYSNNMGLTWNAMTGNALFRTPVYVNGANGTTALYVTVTATGSGSPVPAYSTTWTGTPVSLTAVGAIAPASSTEGAYCKQVGNYICAIAFTGGSSQWGPSSGCTSGIAFCSTSADPTVAANWTRTATLPFQIMDLLVFNGNFVAVGYGGIYTCPIANPTQWYPTNGFYNTNAPVTAGNFAIFAIASNGTTLMAVGQDPINVQLGAIYLSKDGINWTKQNRYIYFNATNANTAFNAFTMVLWDGKQWVVAGGVNNSMIITSPDGLAWEVQYVYDNGEQVDAASLSFPGFYSGTMNYAANLFSPWNTAANTSFFNGLGVSAGAPTNGQRQVGVCQNYSNGAALSDVGNTAGWGTTVACPTIPTGNNPGSALTHYYELILTAGAAVNSFTIQWAIDGVVQPAISAAYQFAPTTDTTGVNQIFFNLPRQGTFVQIDDIYLTNMDGHGASGRLGPQNIFDLSMVSALTSGMTNSISANSNAQTVNSELSNSEGYVYTATKNTQDVYGTSNVVPSNYNVVAVLAEAYFGQLGQGVGVAGAVGLKSGSATKQGSVVSAGTGVLSNNTTTPQASWPARSTVLTETDPKTGAAFTLANLNALDVTVTKTT